MKNELKKLVPIEGQFEISKKVGEFQYSLNAWGLASSRLLDSFNPNLNPLFYTKAIEGGFSPNKIFKLQIEELNVHEQIAQKIPELIEAFYSDEQKKKLIEQLSQEVKRK